MWLLASPQWRLMFTTLGRVAAPANDPTGMAAAPEESPVVRASIQVPAKDPKGVAVIRWTVKRMVAWIREKYGRAVGRETIRKALHRLGFSWKKGKKLLNRADPEQRQAFVERIAGLLKEAATSDDQLLVYIDEAHIHQDADMGYGWSERGRRFWINSSSPALKEKVSFYGLYLYNEAQVRIWDYERANGDHTSDVLVRLRREFPDRRILVIWDGVSYHRSDTVKTVADEQRIELIRLPGYSPDFMPVEALWRWLREDVTYNHCHHERDELLARVSAFEQRINQKPFELADRLWTKDQLHLEEEQLRAHPLGPRASAALGVAA